ncbi:MAG: glutamine-hydrolyzing carbamoyl-phosphate synthase small subunit [Bdellovibrionales bacterium]|nr:glutamine-hydrolyzing carbamoyl-phosphate synthase small subunit [Bdellovibrionales bacterium]
MSQGFLVLESGEVFQGSWLGGKPRAGEVVFNTSHNGYEEIATDPSYFGQIMVMCASQQGNYGVDRSFWESRQLWIEGFICLQMQNSQGNSEWLDRLKEFGIPVMDEVDTRRLVLHLREAGTQVGAMVEAASIDEAKEKAAPLINAHKEMDKDWVYQVSRQEKEIISGAKSSGPRMAILDFGCKENIIRELIKRCPQVTVYPCRTPASEILADKPDGILLSNGPGDPAFVQDVVPQVKELLGKIPIFGICMGHQILAQALGGKTFRLKFGHRGANHPVKTVSSGFICMTSQNHGYAIAQESLPDNVTVTHINLNDNTVSGLQCKDLNCFSVQFHPESHPGPRDAEVLFDEFIEWIEG